jgi:methionyl-tRNA formyltransferase
MNSLRVAFFGSPDFAIPTLRALIDSPYRPIVVITQPDRPSGRGRVLQPPPVKEAAVAAGIPVLQPEKLRDADAIDALAAYKPDLQIVVAYGQILPSAVLDLPAHGTLNVHASLLPRWRGAAPVQGAILAGDEGTGVTIMRVDEGEDTGDILATQVESIFSDDDAGSLSDRLQDIGASLLLKTIPAWLAGRITPIPQDQRLVTRARRIKKQQGRVDWTEPATSIARRVRAFSPWPGAFSTLDGHAIRIWQATATDASSDQEPGTVVGDGETIDVSTGAGFLQVARLQRAGKRATSAAEFTRGAANLIGLQFEVGKATDA